VKKRTFGNVGNKYVCLYLERPRVPKDAYETAAKILWWYGCKANLEETKISFRTYLREKKLDHKMLMKRPQYSLQDTPKYRQNNSGLWGTPGSEKMIKHGLELLVDYVEEFCENIDFVEMIDQLQRYSYVNKGLFDVVSAMGMAEIGDEDMYNTKINTDTEETHTRQDVGWYEDATGKHFGIIPIKNQNPNICLPPFWRMP